MSGAVQRPEHTHIPSLRLLIFGFAFAALVFAHLDGPPPPKAVTATAGHLANRLEWTAVRGAEGYVIYRAGPGETRFRRIAVTPATHFEDRIDAEALGRYRYRIASSRGVVQGPQGRTVANDDVWISETVKSGSGGELIAANGEVRLQVPRRALDEDTRLEIRERPGLSTNTSATALMTPALEFGPDGTVFRRDVGLEVAYHVPGGDRFERGWVSRTACLCTWDETLMAWTELGAGVRMDTERDIASASLRHFSSYAVGYTVMPHGRYAETSKTCRACHSPHDAAESPILARVSTEVCFYCHGNESASLPAAGAHGPNVEAEFLLCADQAPDVFGDSWHPFAEGTLRCSDCHDVHADPGVYPKLLFNWQSDGSKTRVDASSGGAGNGFCFGCHGANPNSKISDIGYYSRSGGDHQTIYQGPHAEYPWTPPPTHDTTCQITPTSGSGVQCLVCHQRHGAEGADYLNAFALGSGAEDKTLCYECHGPTGDSNTWNGRYVAKEFQRASTHDVAGVTGALLACANCHNSHTVTTGTAVWSPARMSDPDNTRNTPSDPSTFCLSCHDTAPPTRTIATSTIVPHSVVFPSVTATFFPGWDKSQMTSGGHFDDIGAGDMSAGCDNCHDPHGSDNARLTAFTGGHFPPLQRANDSRSREERLCFGCHGSRSSWTSCGGGCHDYMPDIETVTKQTPGYQPDWFSRRVGSDPDIHYSVAVGDIDGDGDLDIVSGSRTGEVYVYRNSASGSIWTTVTAYTSSLQINSVAIGRIDGDADNDIVMGVSGAVMSVAWLSNTSGDGNTWSANPVIMTGLGTAAASVAVADVDMDGDSDIVSGQNTGAVFLHENTGSGASWNHVLLHTVVGTVTAVDVGRIDADIDPDVVSVGIDQYVRWYRNPTVGGGGWAMSVAASPTVSLYSARIGDIDGDGVSDLVVGAGWKATTPQGYPIYWYDNATGDGSTWTTTTVTLDVGQHDSVALGDMDADGDTDIVDSSGQVDWYENADGIGAAWIFRDLASLGGSVTSVRVADIDADGHLDVVSASGTWGSAGFTDWHENRLFDPKIGTHPIATFSARHSDVETAGAFGGDRRHVECVDCHEAHTTRRGTHTPGESTAGAVFWGSTGVRPSTWPSAWTTPTGYVAERIDGQSTDLEAYVCFKCHSSYTSLPTTGGSGGYGATDAAMEFNPNNASYHAVVGTSKASTAGGYLDSWSSTSRMTCSDCHTTNLTGGAPKGPHGSAYSFVLKGSWSTTVTPDDYTTSLCGICHDLNTSGFAKPAGGGNLHFSTTGATGLRHRYAPCPYCHSRIPHGFDRPHMIVFTTDPAPYSMQSATYGITSYSHPTSGDYNKTSCDTASTECH